MVVTLTLVLRILVLLAGRLTSHRVKAWGHLAHPLREGLGLTF